MIRKSGNRLSKQTMLKQGVQLAATTTVLVVALAIGEPVYEKVPVPGRAPSEDPAIDGPARTKAKARMKPIVGM
jgi:hypothetical protein